MASCYYEVIWKGQDGVLSIPFDVSGYSEISLTILTLGDVKIVYEQERLTIEDGYITISYDNTDLDVLPDGVIRYIIDYEIGNVDGVLSSNLNAVLKTPEGYSAGTIDELMEEAYESGYTAGAVSAFTEGYDSGYTDGYGSGYTSGRTDGYDEGYTDGDQAGYNEGYDNGVQDGKRSGYTEGVGYQKSLLSAITITTNGDYTRENGYSAVTVSVPQTGATPEQVQEAYNSGYTNGENDGFDNGHTSGYTDGVSYQRSLLSSISITGNGQYVRENGYSAITVDVPQTGATPQQVQQAYDSGYTNGHTSGYTDGTEHQKSLLVSTAITENGSYSRENGYSTISVNVPQTGATPQQLEAAYNSGITEGQRQQKSLLVSTAITVNGTYTRENGYNSVSVNIPQTGYTQQDLDNAFNSGYTNGWNSGYESGYTDGGEGYDEKDYLTFEIVSAGTLLFIETPGFPVDMHYRRNCGRWKTLEATLSSSSWSNYAEIYLNAGDNIQFKGVNASCQGASFRGSGYSPTDNLKFKISGNIMSLLYGDDFESATTITSAYAFYFLFAQNASHLVSIADLKLPATTLTEGCYSHMFTSTDIEKAPELPAPVVPASAYHAMFQGCSNLNEVKCLATDVSASNCTTNWLTSTSSSGTFIKAAGMSSWRSGDSGIPNNWTVVDAS